MNAPRPHFPILLTSALWLPVIAGCVALAGCITTSEADRRVDATSPVAAEVEKLSRTDGKLPTFASIPNKPTDIRPIAQYGRDANSIIAQGSELERATAPGTWTLQGTDAFAEKARRDAGPQIEPPKPGDAEAFARELRERATPPPPR